MNRAPKARPMHCCICNDEVYVASNPDQSAIYDSGRCPRCGTELVEAPRWIAVTLALLLGVAGLALTIAGVV